MWTTSKLLLSSTLFLSQCLLGDSIVTPRSVQVLGNDRETDDSVLGFVAPKPIAMLEQHPTSFSTVRIRRTTPQSAPEPSAMTSTVVWIDVTSSWITTTKTNAIIAASPSPTTTEKAGSPTTEPTYSKEMIHPAQRTILPTDGTRPSPSLTSTTLSALTVTGTSAKQRRIVYEIPVSQLLALGVTSFPPSSPTASSINNVGVPVDSAGDSASAYYVGSISYEIPCSALSALGVTTCATSTTEATTAATTMTTSAGAAPVA